MYRVFTVLFLLGFVFPSFAQVETERIQAERELPYYQIPEFPENYATGNVISRMIDGLGYRYYWATEGLRAEDLAYEPGNEGRKAEDVLDHLYGLSQMVLNASQGLPNIRPKAEVDLTWEEKHAATLHNISNASQHFSKLTEQEISELKIIFQRGEKKSEMDLWYLFNGPLADAIYHCGQIASFRRTAGNPMNPKVNVFMGKNKE